MRTPTNYKSLRSRCAVCGHRLAMHSRETHGCTVVNGVNLGKPTYHEVPCRCTVGA